MVHGDEFFGFGPTDKLDDFEAGMNEAYGCKVKRAGWGRGRDRELRILVRVLTLDDRGASVEADQALLEECISALDSVGSNAVNTLVVKLEHFRHCSAEEILQRRANGECKAKGGKQQNIEVMSPDRQAMPEAKDDDHEDRDVDVDWGLYGNGDEEELLEPGEAQKFLSVGALIKYLAPTASSSSMGSRRGCGGQAHRAAQIWSG